MNNTRRRSTSSHDKAVVEQIMLKLIDDANSEALYREGFIPSAELDEMLEQLPLEGPGQYLSVIVRGVNERCDALRSQLSELLEDKDRRTALPRLGDISKGRYWLLRLFLKGYPRPPFSIIEHVLPVRYEVIVHRWWRPRDSQLEGYLCDLILEERVIEEYLKQPESVLPKNRILRFFVGYCRAARRRRFEQAIQCLIIATENLRGYLVTYLEPYLLHLHFQQEYRDYAD